ncbi:MAG: hypothetical protein OXI41_07200 [Chloroflexota bacterium]|nr:hypothetical protein [Chloroflexota bacterium]MDE2895783.1 hypothetical protein [Chloroflexota bacterium]
MKRAALVLMLAALCLIGTEALAPSQARSEAGGSEMQFWREASEFLALARPAYKPTGGSLDAPFELLKENNPTGPFRVRVFNKTSIVRFDITASDLSVTNGSISGLTKIETSRFGWYFTVTPDSSASQVSVTIAEDAFVHNLKGNQSATMQWSVRDSDAPLVMAMVFTSDNAKRFSTSGYNAGEHIDLTLVYSEQVTVAHGAADADKPYVTFDVNGVEKNAVYLDGSGTEMLRFRYTIESGFPSNGYAAPVSASVQMPTGSSIKETKSVNPREAISDLPPAPIHVTDPRTTTSTDVDTAPTVSPGRKYEFIVRFNQPVTVRGRPGVAIEFTLAGMGFLSSVVCAGYVGRLSTTELAFRYVVPQNHPHNPEHAGSVKHGMCADNSNRITNTASTQDATHYLFSHRDRSLRLDIGTATRVWIALPSVPQNNLTFTFRTDPTGRISLNPTTLTFTPQNALIGQYLDITAANDETLRGQSARILYNVATIVDREFGVIILDTPIAFPSLPSGTSGTSDEPSTRSPDPPNLARNPVSWSPQGGTQALPTRQSEVSANKPDGASGSVDLGAIAASVREQLQSRTRGFYLTTQIFGPGARPGLIRSVPGGGYAIFVDGVRYTLPAGSPLLLVKIWHIYKRPQTGINTIELLGDVFVGRPGDRLTEPVEICLPAPAQDAERARLAVKGRLDPSWTILDTTVEDGQICAQTTRVAWFTIVLEPELAPEREEV